MSKPFPTFLFHIIQLPVSWPTAPHLQTPHVPENPHFFRLVIPSMIVVKPFVLKKWVLQNLLNPCFETFKPQRSRAGIAQNFQHPHLTIKIQRWCCKRLPTPASPWFNWTLTSGSWTQFCTTHVFQCFSQRRTFLRPAWSIFELKIWQFVV